MRRLVSFPDYQDCYEYNGGMMLETIRNTADRTIKRDWILFDSVEEAQDFFNTRCITFGGFYAESTC